MEGAQRAVVLNAKSEILSRYPALFRPERFHAAAEVLGRPSAAPANPGVYAWYFNAMPPLIDASECHSYKGLKLLYVGISPKAPPANGRPPSRSTLKARLRTHYGGNAEGSTLRRTLGCLLSGQLGIKLRRVGSGGRYTFTNPGEQALDRWMQEHAFVTWMQTSDPHKLEREILASGIRLPLNIDSNPCAEDVAILREARLAARRLADELEVVSDNGGPRRTPIS
jgi:hypothetical protein